VPKTHLTIGFGRKTVELILAAVCLAYILAIVFVVDISRIQDRKALEQNERFVRLLIREKEEWLKRTAVDYADWGAAYRHLHKTVDVDWAYHQDNLGPSLVRNFNIEYAAVYGPDGSELYGLYQGDLARSPIDSMIPALDKIVSRARAMQPRDVASAILIAEGDAVLIAASIISPGEDTTTPLTEGPPSVLVFGDRIGEQELAQIRQSLGLDRLRLVEIARTGHSSIPVFLKADEGAAGFMLDIAAPKPGTEVLHAIVPSVALVGSIIAVLLVLLARQGVREANTVHKAATELAESHKALEQKALFDPLTGLSNRYLFTQRLEEALKAPDRSVSVLFIDLDRFKPINDTFGHEAGDFILREIGRRLKTLVKPGDLCARLGGDEFVVLTFDQDESSLHRLCRATIRSISEGMCYGDRILSVGVSIGIAQSTPGKDTLEDILRRADRALYNAKSSGRSRYCWSSEEPLPERASA